jgi:hypothetical protein
MTHLQQGSVRAGCEQRQKKQQQQRLSLWMPLRMLRRRLPLLLPLRARLLLLPLRMLRRRLPLLLLQLLMLRRRLPLLLPLRARLPLLARLLLAWLGMLRMPLLMPPRSLPPLLLRLRLLCHLSSSRDTPRSGTRGKTPASSASNGQRHIGSSACLTAKLADGFITASSPPLLHIGGEHDGHFLQGSIEPFDVFLPGKCNPGADLLIFVRILNGDGTIRPGLLFVQCGYPAKTACGRMLQTKLRSTLEACAEAFKGHLYVPANATAAQAAPKRFYKLSADWAVAEEDVVVVFMVNGAQDRLLHATCRRRSSICSSASL